MEGKKEIRKVFYFYVFFLWFSSCIPKTVGNCRDPFSFFPFLQATVMFWMLNWILACPILVWTEANVFSSDLEDTNANALEQITMETTVKQVQNKVWSFSANFGIGTFQRKAGLYGLLALFRHLSFAECPPRLGANAFGVSEEPPDFPFECMII